MKTILFILFSISSLYASYSTEQAKGQDPSLGSFYMPSDRTKFRNPSKLEQTLDSIYLESAGEFGYKNNNWGASVGRKIDSFSVFDGFYQLNENAGISGNFSAKNSEGISTWGMNFGLNIEDFYSFYIGFQDSKGSDFMPKMGFSLDCYSGILFAEYQGQIFHVEEYQFNLGFGKEYKKFFGDLIYFKNSEDLQTLTATIGAKTALMENLYGLASGQKELFFTKKGKINVGLEYKLNNLKFDLAHSLTAFAKDSPKYKDFDLSLSAAYFF